MAVSSKWIASFETGIRTARRTLRIDLDRHRAKSDATGTGSIAGRVADRSQNKLNIGRTLDSDGALNRTRPEPNYMRNHDWVDISTTGEISAALSTLTCYMTQPERHIRSTSLYWPGRAASTEVSRATETRIEPCGSGCVINTGCFSCDAHSCLNPPYRWRQAAHHPRTARRIQQTRCRQPSGGARGARLEVDQPRLNRPKQQRRRSDQISATTDDVPVGATIGTPRNRLI